MSVHSGVPGRTSDRKDRSVLIAVDPPSFQRLIQHVLHGQSGLRVVGGSSKGVSHTRLAARLTPGVIVANERLQRRGRGDVVELKRSSPSSILILLTHSLAESVAPERADACLPEEAVVRRLLPMIRKAALRAADRTPQPAPAGPRT